MVGVLTTTISSSYICRKQNTQITKRDTKEICTGKVTSAWMERCHGSMQVLGLVLGLDLASVLVLGLVWVFSLVLINQPPETSGRGFSSFIYICIFLP